HRRRRRLTLAPLGGEGTTVRRQVLTFMAYTAAAALLLGWMWLMPAVGLWVTLAAELRPEPEPTILVVPAPQIVTAQVAAAEPEVKTASWYGEEFAGKPMASGSAFDPSRLTAAHRSWPFGTWVRLHNPANGREVAVQITDRGPYDPSCLPRLCPHPTRQLDLSRAAAEALGIVDQGVADLEARVLVWGDSRAEGGDGRVVRPDEGR